MLTALKSNYFSQAHHLFSCIFVALQESPIFRDGPGRAVDLTTVPLDERLCVLNISSNGLFRKNMLSSHESGPDESWLALKRQSVSE